MSQDVPEHSIRRGGGRSSRAFQRRGLRIRVARQRRVIGDENLSRAVVLLYASYDNRSCVQNGQRKREERPGVKNTPFVLQLGLTYLKKDRLFLAGALQ